jgi:hypothetical protein
LIPSSSFVALCLCGAALTLSACASGSSSSAPSAGSGSAAMTKAKAALATSCQAGSSSALDRRLCACIADEASTHDAYDTPGELDALREDQNTDHVPAVLGQVAVVCGDRLSTDG